MKVLVGAFNQEKALVGTFSVIVKTLLMVCLKLFSKQNPACFQFRGGGGLYCHRVVTTKVCCTTGTGELGWCGAMVPV